MKGPQPGPGAMAQGGKDNAGRFDSGRASLWDLTLEWSSAPAPSREDQAMRLVDEVEIIEAPFWGRPQNLVVFRGRRVALIDTGIQGQPADYVLPALRSLGIDPRDISWIINTHTHVDHIGGSEEILRASKGGARFGAVREERTAVEFPGRETRRALSHYVSLGVMTDVDLDRHVDAAGKGVRLDL